MYQNFHSWHDGHSIGNGPSAGDTVTDSWPHPRQRAGPAQHAHGFLGDNVTIFDVVGQRSQHGGDVVGASQRHNRCDFGGFAHE